MGLFQADMGWRSIRHAVEASKIHEEDARLSRANLQYDFHVTKHKRTELPFPEVPGFAVGWQYTMDEAGVLSRADEPTFTSHLDKYRLERNWYWAKMTTKGVSRIVKRKRKKVIQQFGITFTPWHSLAIAELAKTDMEAARAMIDKCVRLAVKEFAEHSGRDVLAASVHIKKKHCLHLHIQNTRINKQHVMVGMKGNRSLSQWTIGVIRQVEAGVLGEGSDNFKLAKENVQYFKNRHKDTTPVNFAMCRALDRLCSEMIGQHSMLLTVAFKIYKAWLEESRRSDLEQQKEGAEKELVALGLKHLPPAQQPVRNLRDLEATKPS